ncbi:2-amino-4-hydroxy-6-hydroxymethyldihydropteridine diphosphokinase [Thalassobaculum sp.]|uniref:2-amino-4-hydroxy-6- hydroxymethyldihydropteridine diphosphokinase n=1 Tax=Thalassobaculum sp. TaxID=2022740 RepID=UPI003B5A1011
MIIVAIGANLPASGYETPLSTCEAAVVRLAEDADIQVTGRSRWYESEPVPKSDQPWFVNGAVSVETDLLPEVLLARLHVIEESFGRVRRVRNEARPLDLDLIDYDGQVRIGAVDPTLPHPRAGERAFVLLPIRDLDPDWRHPVTGEAVSTLIAGLPDGGGEIRALED